MSLLLVPGINNSGPEHWQTLWEQHPERECRRFEPRSWDEPDAWDWVAATERALGELGPDCVVVAHSLGCLAAAHVAASTDDLLGVVLVAPPDLHGPEFPATARRFDELDAAHLRVPGLMIASGDDPYCSLDAAARLAEGWGASFVDVGRLGHINAASGLGPWDDGWNLVTAFRAGLGPRAEAAAG